MRSETRCMNVCAACSSRRVIYFMKSIRVHAVHQHRRRQWRHTVFRLTKNGVRRANNDKMHRRRDEHSVWSAQTHAMRTHQITHYYFPGFIFFCVVSVRFANYSFFSLPLLLRAGSLTETHTIACNLLCEFCRFFIFIFRARASTCANSDLYDGWWYDRVYEWLCAMRDTTNECIRVSLSLSQQSR